MGWVPLGLLASGGSGFWNSIQTYVAKAKEVKKIEIEEEKAATEVKKVETEVKKELL